MKRLERALLLMVLAISLLFSSAPSWAQGNEPVHVYILLDAGSMYPEETRFVGTITAFAEQIKRQNPRNRVSVVVKNDVMSKDTYGNFFGNYRGFTHRENLIFEKRDYTLKDSMERVEAMQKKDDPSLRKVLLIIDGDGGVDTAAERKYNFRTHYHQYADLATKTYLDIMRASAPFCRNQEVYSVRFPIGIEDAETPETYPYILKSTNLRNQFGKQILDGLQNRGYYEMKESDPQELHGVLRRYEKKIAASTSKRVPAPYTITESVSYNLNSSKEYYIMVTIAPSKDVEKIEGLRIELSLPSGFEIVKGKEDTLVSTDLVTLPEVEGAQILRWRIRWDGKPYKDSDKIRLIYSYNHYANSFRVTELEVQNLTRAENFWNFRNYSGSKDHQFSNPGVQKLFDSLPDKERELVEEGFEDSEGGYCYGMSFTSVLAQTRRLDKERAGLRDENNHPIKNSEDIRKATKESAEDIIHLYHASQCYAVQNDGKWRIKSNKEGIEKLISYMHKVEKNGAPPVLLTFKYWESWNESYSHALVMYNMIPWPGDDYDYAIYYYDSNGPGNLHQLLVNEKNGQFKSLDKNLNKGKITRVIDDVTPLDPFRMTGVIDQSEFGKLRDATFNPIVFISPSSGILSLTSQKSGRSWIIDTDNMEKTKLDWRSLSAGEGSGRYAITLPEGEVGYRLRPERGDRSLDALVSYKDQLINVTVSKAGELTFDPKGTLGIKGAQGTVHAKLVRNKRKGSEENFYAVKGRANGDIALSQTSSGLKGEGKLSNVQLRYGSGKNRKETKGIAEFNGGYLLGAKAAGLPFSDVAQSSWYYPAVRYVYEKGLMTGVNADTFSPETTITRAQMAQIIYNMEGGKPAKNPSSFKDVPSNHWSYKAVSWAKEKNIVKGYEDGSFKPNAPITRQDAVAILYRYKIKEATANLSRNKYDGFKDRDQVAAYAQEPMAWAVDRGIVNGDNNKRLNPRNHMKRAEMAQILKNGNKIFH